MKELKVCVLVHGPGTRPAALVEWGFDRGHAVDLRNLHLGDPLPGLDDFDFLISTGGPMNCYQDDEFPFLFHEAQLIAEALRARKGVLGLCLGAQLMARAAGGSVRSLGHWEVGWHKVSIEDQYLGKGEIMAFQWHQDTFEPPEGALHIATSAAAKNQGFRLSSRAVGVQFHPEATAEWVRECAVDPQYPSGVFVQEPSELVQGLIHQPALNYWLRGLLHQIEGDL